MKPQFLIGCDPDTTASGIAVYDTATKRLTNVACLSFWDTIEMLSEYIPEDNDMPHAHVYMSAGWLISKANWRGGSNTFVSQKIAGDVGRNHMVGILIVEFCKKHGIPVTELKPDGKWPIKLTRKLTGYKGKLNQDTCDAIRCVWGR